MVVGNLHTSPHHPMPEHLKTQCPVMLGREDRPQPEAASYERGSSKQIRGGGVRARYVCPELPSWELDEFKEAKVNVIVCLGLRDTRAQISVTCEGLIGNP